MYRQDSLERSKKNKGQIIAYAITGSFIFMASLILYGIYDRLMGRLSASDENIIFGIAFLFCFLACVLTAMLFYSSPGYRRKDMAIAISLLIIPNGFISFIYLFPEVSKKVFSSSFLEHTKILLYLSTGMTVGITICIFVIRTSMDFFCRYAGKRRGKS